jgi:chromosome segregation ATPase
MGNFDRFYDQPREYVSFESAPIRPKERVMRLPGATPTADMRGGDGAVLDLVYQAAEVIKGIEDRATEIEKTSYQQLQLKERRIEELEAELRTAQALINETRIKLKESDEVARADRARLEAAEKRLSEFEMRAKTAEAQARENAHAVFRIEEAIRTQLLAKRLPSNKLALSV